jgi:peptide/nickel transport system permease protein
MPFSRKRRLERLHSGSGVARALPIGGLISLAVLAVIVLASLIGPAVIGYSPITVSGDSLMPPGSEGHLLGTDNLGFDVLSRVLVGTRSSLFAAVVVTVVAALFGTFIGIVAGFCGGWADAVLMRITDLFLAFPAMIVAMALAAALKPGLMSSMIGIMVVWWPLYARLVRGETRRIVTSTHVESARLSGTRGARLVVRHVMPAVLPSVVVTASMDIGSVIMTIASLSFIGLGAPAPAPELGLMASQGMQYVLNAWWIPVFPGLMVGVFSLLFNYLGDCARNLLRGMEV